MRASYLFTSESVSEGHPDKVCDRISDEIVDLFFREGPKAGIDPWAIRAACETLATTNKVVIAGETRGPKSVTNEISPVGQIVIGHAGDPALPTSSSQTLAQTLPDEKRPDPEPDLRILPTGRYGGDDVWPARGQ